MRFGNARITVGIASLFAVACGEAPGLADPSGTLAFVTISPGEAIVIVGEARQFTVTLYDTGGHAITDRTVTWTVEAPSVASINQNGVVTGLRAGSTRLIARAGSLADTATITVIQTQDSTGDITVDPRTTFQTISGWEIADWVGQWACGSGYPTTLYELYAGQVFDGAVDLGINRIRLHVRSGQEHPQDGFAQFVSGQITEQEWRAVWYTAVNDNADPNTINPAGFQWSETDLAVDRVVLPLKQRLEARGEKLYISLNFTKFDGGGLDYQRMPQEYAEFILATFLHLQEKYGWVPDAVEIILEPDTGNDDWTGAQIGNALVAAANRLLAAGFTPEFIAPSNAHADRAVRTFDEMIKVTGVPLLLSEFSYHRYGSAPNAQLLQNIAQRGTQYGVRTSMLEHIGSGYEDLHADLKLANVSAWQQYALAGCAPGDPGGRHFLVDATNSNNPLVRMASRTHFLRQYFKYIRRGAVRVAANSSVSGLDPLAFIHPDGRHVVVVKASAAASFTVGGLPAGTYGVVHTTGPDEKSPTQSAVEAGDVVLAAGQALTASIPGKGVVTIFAK